MERLLATGRRGKGLLQSYVCFWGDPWVSTELWDWAWGASIPLS